MLTKLLVIRHGKFLNQGYAEDSLCPLSDDGREAQFRMAQFLDREGIFPTSIFCSPLLRAQQSAEVMAKYYSLPFEDEEALGNEFDMEKLLSKIPLPKKNETVFFVGHAPTLAQFVEKLVGRNVLPEGISKSASVLIHFDDKIQFGEGKFISYYKV